MQFLKKNHQHRHSRENGNPVFSFVVSLTSWIPAFAGMTSQKAFLLKKNYFATLLKGDNMKKSVLVLIIFLVLTFFISSHCHADSANQMNITVKVDVSFSSVAQEYEYKYTIISNKESVIDMDKVMIEYEGENPKVLAPNNWKKELSRRFGANMFGVPNVAEIRSPNNKFWVTWQAVPKVKDRLKPNSKKEGFIMKTKGSPGIVMYYAKEYVPQPTQEELNKMSEEEQFEREKTFGNTLKNKTLGPVLSPIRPPAKLSPTLFTSTIIGYVDEASQLGWISDATVKVSINGKLNSVKENLGIKDNQSAIKTLNLLLEELEEKHGKGINDEGYLLLKFNVEYLKDRL